MTEVSKEVFEDGHLIVAIHGLWGVHSHVDSIVISLDHVLSELYKDKQFKSQICILKPKSSAYFKTFDGVEAIGDRFLSEIYEEIVKLKNDKKIRIKKFSVVGYSLGGLIARYIIGELYEVGFFDTVEPVFFTTFATPHIGVKFFTNPLSPILNFLGPRILSNSGADLFLLSDMVSKLANKDLKYYKALSIFKQRYLLANVRHDRTVAFYTAYLSNFGPFENWDKINLKFLKDLPEIKFDSDVIKPRIIDLKRTRFKTEEERSSQKPKSFKEKLRFMGIIILMVCIFPIWLPSVLLVNIMGTLSSKIRLGFFEKKIDNAAQWKRTLEVLNSDEVDHTGEERKSESTRSTEENIISKEVANITENTIENVLDVADDGEDLKSNDDDDDELETVSSHDALLGSENTPGGFENKISLDILSTTKTIDKFLAYLDTDTNSIRDFPLFNDAKLSNAYPFDKERCEILDSLNELHWYKMSVYIDSFNAHAGMVSRRGAKSSKRGFATIYFWSMLLGNQLAKFD